MDSQWTVLGVMPSSTNAPGKSSGRRSQRSGVRYRFGFSKKIEVPAGALSIDSHPGDDIAFAARISSASSATRIRGGATRSRAVA